MIKKSITVFSKEMKCLFRDRKSFFASLILPALLIFFVLLLVNASLGAKIGGKTAVSVSYKENAFCEFLIKKDVFEIKTVAEPYEALKSGEISGYILIDKNADEKILNGENFSIDVDYMVSSSDSKEILSLVSSCESEFKSLVSAQKFGDAKEIYEFVSKNTTKAEKAGLNKAYTNYLLPVISALYACVAMTSAAAELSAGEKERGTWEPLLATGVSRKCLVLGKVLAVSLMAFLSSLSSIFGFFAYVFLALGRVNFSPASIFEFLLILALFEVFASSGYFAFGVISKSSKEAQLYALPVSAVFTAHMFFLNFINVQNISFKELCIPGFNVVCVVCEIFSMNFNLIHFLAVCAWMILYFFVILKITEKLLSKESVIFRI